MGRTFPTALTAAVLVLAVAAPPIAAYDKVAIIIADDLGLDWLSCFEPGPNPPYTPNICTVKYRPTPTRTPMTPDTRDIGSAAMAKPRPRRLPPPVDTMPTMPRTMPARAPTPVHPRKERTNPAMAVPLHGAAAWLPCGA